MKKLLILGLLATVISSGFAENLAKTNNLNRLNGGMVARRYPKSNHVYFINAQKSISSNEIADLITTYEFKLRTPVDYAEGTFDFPEPKVQGVYSVFIIDDEKLPMTLCALESRWACVNVARLRSGRGEKKPYFNARVKKACIRAASMLFGGLGSTYRNNLFGVISSPEDLDKIEIDAMPVDVLMRCSKQLQSQGVKPLRVATYSCAVMEGWAPPPTNDIQKAIWDKVHTIPTKPIKIEFDPKTDTK